jgi:hypothetical protein
MNEHHREVPAKESTRACAPSTALIPNRFSPYSWCFWKSDIVDYVDYNSSMCSSVSEWMIPTVFGSILLVNVGFLWSVVPAVRGRGAPYVPTKSANADIMFSQLRRHMLVESLKSLTLPPSVLSQQQQNHYVEQRQRLKCLSLQHVHEKSREDGSKLQEDRIRKINKRIFVDLGSGDGRLVFRAAREGLFDLCIGYEINPFLFWYSRLLNVIRYYYYNVASLTIPSRRIEHGTQVQFFQQSLWEVNLHHAHVVSIYGLGPMMSDLGQKLRSELPPGALVVSNIFSFPDWRPLEKSKEGTFIYRVN